MGNEVPRKVEHVYLPRLAPAVVAAWERITGGKPTKNLLRSLISIIWIETGHGNLVCNSPGNVAVAGFYNGVEKILDWWKGDYWRPGWYSDESEALHAKMLKGQAPSGFAAYPTLEAGLEHWVKVLRKSFPSVITAGQTGNAAELVKALHDSKYSTDYQPKHVKSFEDLWAELATNKDYGPIEATLPGALTTSSSSSSSGSGLGLVLGLGAVSAVGFGAWWFMRRRR
jgi:hypothetical protein